MHWDSCHSASGQKVQKAQSRITGNKNCRDENKACMQEKYTFQSRENTFVNFKQGHKANQLTGIYSIYLLAQKYTDQFSTVMNIFYFSDEEAFPGSNNFSFDTPKQMFFKLKPLNKQVKNR